MHTVEMSFQTLALVILIGVLLTADGQEFEDEDLDDSTEGSPLDVILELPSDITISTEEVAEESNSNGTLEGPRNLVVVNASSTSILLKWEFSPLKGTVEGYRIYYRHENFKDVKTLLKPSSPSFRLDGLDPYTTYEIWLEGIVSGHYSEESEHIWANTEVDAPSSPLLSNITCLGTGAISVEWYRPERYDQSVDYYKLFFRATSEDEFSTVLIPSDAKEEKSTYVINNLIGNKNYLVKLTAGTISLSDGDKVWFGEPSDEKLIYLPRENCKPGILEAEFQGELSAGMIVGAVFALLFLILSVIGFVIWRRYFKAAYYYLDEPQRTAGLLKEMPNWEEELGPDGGKGAVKLEDFANHVASLHADSDIGFAKEYEEIQNHCLTNVKSTHEHSAHADNKCKNRYLNIVAYDHSRVRLMPIVGQKKTSDYINANYIDGFQRCNAYIGTQGPLEHTFEAFWRMVWEQNVYVIVMITNLVERGRRKCDHYWPKEDMETFGSIEVTLLKEETMANYTVRTMKIRHLKLKRKKGFVSEREVKQFHYTSWPDHGVPCHPLPVLTYIRKSVDANPEDGGPIVVHCSAGVGRTGTYIVIDSMLQQVRAKNEFSVYGFLKHIRGQRNYLVQTEEQYVFIHDALLEAIVSGNTEIEREKLAEFLEHLVEMDSDSKSDAETKRLLDKQFELITAFTPSTYQYSSARMECNQNKNRDSELIPVESSRIPLAPKPGVEGSDYINASWLHGHNKLKEFILTQHPTGEVREDFWRMLWDHNSQTVVLLSAIDSEDFPPFWPEKEDEYDLETFKVRFVEEAIHEGHSTLDFVVSSQHDDYELTVRIIYCPEWPRHVPDFEDLFEVLKVVQDWHLEYQDGPLVVVDKYGGTEGASFCALTTLCKELDTFNAIDVYQVAKLYHNKRPGIWKSADDILYLYKAMEALVASKRANPVHDHHVGESLACSPSTCVAIDMEKTYDLEVNNISTDKAHSLSPQHTTTNGGTNLIRSRSSNGLEHTKAITETTLSEDESKLLNSNNLQNGVYQAVPEFDEEEEISETAALTKSCGHDPPALGDSKI